MIRLYRLLTVPPLTLALLLLPIAGFFTYFFALRYDIPWFDEYENIPYFLDRFLRADSPGERMTALLRPNNEHRVVYARLVVLGQYALTGGLNFANLMLWGNLGLVLIFCLLYYALRRHESVRNRRLQRGRVGREWVGMLPVPLLLFTAQNYLLTFTAIYTLQYLAIIMLALLTFFVLATDRPLNLAGALGLGMLSTFSMGNGLLVWPAGAGLLLLQRRWPALGIWLVVGAIGGWAYFLNYPVQQGNAEGFAYVVRHPLQTGAGFLIFAGSVFDLLPMLAVEYRIHLPLVMGGVLVVGLVSWLVRTLFRRKPNLSFFDAFVFGCLLFLLANIGLIALFRIRFYFGLVLHSTYRTYALVLWAVAVVLLFSRLSEAARARYWPIVWLLFLGINLLTYFTYLPEAIERRKQMQALTFNQANRQIGLGGTRNSALARYITDLTALMRERGWYQLPNPAITPDEQELLAFDRRSASADTVPAKPLRIRPNAEYISVESDEPDYTVGLNTGTYLVFASADSVQPPRTYLLFASRNRPAGRKPWQRPPGFSAPMPVRMVPAGPYRVGLFRTYPDHSRLQFSNQVVRVP